MVKKGEIYLVLLEPRSGSEQRGERPFVIISGDAFNKYEHWKTVSGIPITSSRVTERKGKVNIFISEGTGNLKKDSLALCGQITTIDESKIMKKIGSLPEDKIKEIEKGLMLYLDIDFET